MTKEESLEKLFSSFKQYYNIKTQDVVPPFKAEAVFHMHNEQYFLVKSAKISDMDSSEYVYFALEDNLCLKDLMELSDKAWSTGLSNVVPKDGHKNSDVILIVVSDSVDREVIKGTKKIKKSKSYRFGLYGWSNFKLIVIDLGCDAVACNRLGCDMAKNIRKILAM